MGNQITKGERLLQAASEGDTKYVQSCMAHADTREKLLLKTKTGFLHHNEGVLHLAAKRGQLHALTAVLGPIVDAVTLEIAERQYPGPTAQLLTQLVNQTDSRGRTPFLTACHHGHWNCAEQLLEAGSNIFAVDRDGNSCLHLAAVHSHVEVVSQLLTKAEAEAVTLRLTIIVNLSGFTPLHYAAHAGNAELVRQLLAAGVDSLQGTVQDYDRWMMVLQGTTALHIAAMGHQSGVCIMLLQLYALQLREWLPGDPLPVDPRTRVDIRGATPLNVALWKGLAPNSQLAICLNPRLDVLSLFSDQQLDDVRRKGPQALKVLAATAVRSKLLQQLRDVTDQQQQLILLQQMERQQQQRRSKQQQQQQQQQQQRRMQKSDVQRWWRSRRSTDIEVPTAAAAAAVAGSRPFVQGCAGSSSSSNQRALDSPFHCSSAADINLPGGSSSSSSMAAIKPADHPNGSGSSSAAVGGSSSSEEQVNHLLQSLQRTPSITLGAMHYTHTIDKQQQQQHTGNSIQHGSTAASSVALATATDSRRHSSPTQRLHPSSSITLACLDQVWKHNEQQQQRQQQQHKDLRDQDIKQQQQPTSKVTPLEAVTQQQCQSVEQSTEIEAETIAGHHQQQQQQQQQKSQQQQQCPQPPRPHSGVSQILTGLAATAADDAATEVDCYEHINEQMHKAMGCTKSFQLVTPSATTTTTTSSSSSSSSMSEDEGKQAADQQQQQLVPPTPKQQQEQPIRQRSLGVTSIALGQLQRNGSSSGSSSVAGDAGYSSSSSNVGFRSHDSKHIGQRSISNKILTTAGIQNQQVMTPFAFRLFQQQQKGYAAAAAAKIQQQQQAGANFCLMPAAAAASSSSSQKAAPNPSSYQSSHSTSHPISQLRSPHRRSLEVHGGTGNSMSAVFGANRAHIARMLEEAGTIDPRNLYQSLSRKGSLVVATSLAGALPGCVSTKLVQCVDLERTSSLPQGLKRSSSIALSRVSGVIGHHQQQQQLLLPSTAGSSTGPKRAGSIDSEGLSSINPNLGEVCAICCDRVSTVAISSCGHTMCSECVRVIVQESVGCRAPLCPFCRVNITGFRLAAVAPAAGGALQRLALS